MTETPHKKPSVAELRARLTPDQYRCTQEDGTEKPFHNAFWNHHEDGLYVDVVSGQPLFTSLDKYDSGSGWPSFVRPIDGGALTERTDLKLGMKRVEVRSKGADSHLGHVFDDGPAPTGQRFCINSASLRFVPLQDLQSQGYGRYLFRFAEKMGGEVATLAGGCFWGMEKLLKEIPGVIETQVGFSGGATPDASYEQVKTGRTGHAEAVQILFDPRKLSFETLLLWFFKMHDPTQANRQGNDIGTQYRSAVFYHGEQQREIAESIKDRVDHSGKWGRPAVTEILPYSGFFRAEEDHQNYLGKHPHGYTCHFIRKIDF